MFNILGFNFLFDSYALNPRPTNIEPLNSVTISNGIFDEINISSQVDSSTIDTTIPLFFSQYDYLLCNFNGNINGGNLESYDFNSVKIKRRIYGTFNWITLFEIEINNPQEDLFFTRYDRYAKNNTMYEYAFVPMIGNNEGNYIISSVYSKFNKVYLCDESHMYALDAGVEFGEITKSNKTSIFEPLMGKYPVVISNAELKYKSGTLSGIVITPQEEQTKTWDIEENVKLQNEILDFLVNKRAKIYKDWMGNSYLILIVENVSLSINNNLSGKLASIVFNFVEIGDTESQEDLYENGLIDVQTA